jgi:tetratricopeptide (TPR) repeat protein
MIGRVTQMGTSSEVPGQVTWPVASGLIPPPADFYTPRAEASLAAAGQLEPGETVVLVTAGEVVHALGAVGGTGKTELAVTIAHTLWDQRSVDLLLWVTAASRDAVVTGYRQALADIGEPEPYGGPEVAAAHFLAWLAETGRPWLVVLDDLTDPAVLEGLWPHGTSGRVVVTTNRPDSAPHAPSTRVVEVGPFSRRESLNYLHARLHADPDQWTGALDLAIDLGFLPITLAQAGAVIAETKLDCNAYRAHLARQRAQLGSQAELLPSSAAAAVALAIDLADQLSPAGLAWPALAVISMLDPNGIPGAVLSSTAACAFLDWSAGGVPVDSAQARTAVHNLARVGLVTIDTTSAARTIRAHPLVQALTRQALPASGCEQAARAAAGAVLAVWPQDGMSPAFDQALRDCTARLRQVTGTLLWQPECHPVLLRAGESLDNAGLHGPAISYWLAMIDYAQPILGAAHPHAIYAADRLAAAYQAAGRPADAIPVYEQVLAGREHSLGVAHPDTLAARDSLGRAYRAAGLAGDAIQLAERSLAESERTQGPGHPATLAARSELGQAYLSAGRSDEAVAAFERALAGQAQVLGPVHPDTLAAQASLAHAYRAAGRLADAVPLYERALAGQERLHGPDHPDTLTARGNLASAYRATDRLRDAIALYRRTLAGREKLNGPDHPDTLTARGNLADTYHLARRLKDALPLYERTLADRERVQGPSHPDTITARGNLAAAYHSARKITMALPLYERTLADCERVLGPSHPDSLALRGNLAHAYHTAGRATEALTMFEDTLADCERVLGPSHPLTAAARENYQAATRV